MCGEQSTLSAPPETGSGSSLRVRGLTAHLVAATTARGPGRPCVCGEQGVCERQLALVVGSSLRVRGTAVWLPIVDVLGEVIPACAGNRLPHRCPPPNKPGHPCVCGEQEVTLVVNCGVPGSSLRVRETDDQDASGIRFSGVIPACAGNRRSGRQRNSLQRGHPCVCGEQTIRTPAEFASAGSSLRVRGTVGQLSVLTAFVRVIPACAGNRAKSWQATKDRPGHPLRVRGTALAAVLGIALSRVIPACAGNRSEPSEGSTAPSESSLRVQGAEH